MQKSLWIKALVVFGLMLALLVPLGMIQGLVDERSQRQQTVVDDIAASSTSAQYLLGPVLVVPYIENWQETVETLQYSAGNKARPKKHVEEHSEEHVLYFQPEELNLDGNLAVETKHRGLFKVRSYVLDGAIKGRFVIPAEFGKPVAPHKGKLVFAKPYVGVAVADMRGVLDAPGFDWNGKRFAFEQGSQLPLEDTPGMHAAVETIPSSETETAMPFSFQLKLRGLENLDLVPMGRQTQVALSSPWPHPGFHGRFLPEAEGQSIGPEGFRVRWSVNALASNVADNIGTCKTVSCFDSFGVKLVDPINIYSLSDRATKYGFLFVCLGFASIFLFEVLKRLAIHPAQYALVGLALAMFFLLLLSLSEHIGFAWAYAIAACACVGLLVFYLSAVMGGFRRAAGAGGFLGGLFAALYGLLQSEDNALLLGSVLLFALLALAMVATRRVDWYRLGQMADRPA
jgi:inner membrane protein